MVDPAGQSATQAATSIEEMGPGETVPDRPARASGVRLIGEFGGSAFKDRQWLIERDGHFVQVPELLYRIAEYANSERTLVEIASLVTDSTSWTVSAEQIRKIIAAKLIPFAIITPSLNGTTPGFRTRRPAPSPLQLRLKREVLGPRIIEPVTRILRFLFLPTILIPLLIAAGASQGWLYFHHGLAAGMRDVVYTPGALGGVLILLIASMVFHEFGHASGLHYGGARARSMGLGLYLVFPAFYTDTTESYRLGRWSRVRTDLGGFYFQMIFALAVCELYFATGQEWLLVSVALIDMLIARGLIPFVRFDGYWALTDLLGMPDIMTHMKSAARSGWRRRSTKRIGPQLKPWARPLFAVYALVTAPILALLLAMLFLRAPLFLSGLWTALLIAQEKMARAWLEHRPEAGVGAGLALAILALQAAGIAYILGMVSTRVLLRLWRWGSRSTGRRIASVVFGGTAIVVLGCYWTMALGLTTGGVPDGVQTYQVSQRSHVRHPVAYSQSPPVGGPHSPIWQNCGFYRTPIANERGVHSMEHGAVWITYRPDLPAGEVAALRVLAIRETYVLVSPYPGLPAPVVASAWGRQLRLTSAGDPRLDQFVRVFRLASSAPEHGGLCTRGLGTPST
jgi:putative peptide zinc metalloprotease protein